MDVYWALMDLIYDEQICRLLDWLKFDISVKVSVWYIQQ